MATELKCTPELPNELCSCDDCGHEHACIQDGCCFCYRMCKKRVGVDVSPEPAGTKTAEVSPLPKTSPDRKAVPMAAGLLDYFPAALAEVARVSKAGNDQHNPGQPMHHARGKSMDHADCIIRHLVDRGTTDTDGMRHSAKVAWRALALLQEELESDGAPLARGAKQS